MEIELQQIERELRALRETRDWRGAIAVLDDFLRRNPDFNFHSEEIAILTDLLLKSQLQRGWTGMDSVDVDLTPLRWHSIVLPTSPAIS